MFIPLSGVKEIDGDKAHHERDGGNDLKIDQRLYADAAHLFQVTHARDAQHDAEKNDGRQRHADEPDEAIAQRLERGGGVGKSTPTDVPRATMATSTCSHNGPSTRTTLAARRGLLRLLFGILRYSARCRITLMRSLLPSKPMPGSSGMVM